MDFLASYRISVPGSTQVSSESWSVFVYRTFTFSGWLFHTILLTSQFITLICQTLQPRRSKLRRFGLFPVRSPLLGELFLFLWVLRCFSSPGSLYTPMYSTCNAVGSQRLVSQFGDPRIIACSQLPEAYRSVPRPSSALIAKASTVSS